MTTTGSQAQDRYDISHAMPYLAWRVLVVFTVLVVLSLVILVAGKLYGRSLVYAGHTSSLQRFDVAIGNDTLSVPANTIRDEAQRRHGPAKRLDLYAHWPDMAGFVPALARQFSDVSPETNAIVFISIQPRSTTRDMAGRFDAVYRAVMRDETAAAIPGLKSHLLSPDYGYIGESLFYSAVGAQTGQRFVARCQDTAAADHIILAPCAIDIHFGETLAAEIRFPARLLAEWQALGPELRRFLDALLASQTG